MAWARYRDGPHPQRSSANEGQGDGSHRGRAHTSEESLPFRVPYEQPELLELVVERPPADAEDARRERAVVARPARAPSSSASRLGVAAADRRGVRASLGARSPRSAAARARRAPRELALDVGGVERVAVGRAPPARSTKFCSCRTLPGHGWRREQRERVRRRARTPGAAVGRAELGAEVLRQRLDVLGPRRAAAAARSAPR